MRSAVDTSTETYRAAMLERVADLAEQHAKAIAGGGETITAIEKYGIEKDISYISTGGGASGGGRAWS